ncbi:MAG: glycoside hydrolase family protein [Hydrococcus sp. Prado102]|jgi:GH24 family phage-related lysozyme (muramidase)|nr:glycoside hydrolase family protein [Hydrococcus sp. Prado102]
MNISQNCLDLIKKWEGFRANAYLDPVGIPTIGYGTICYPNGQKIQIGDVISESEAEDLLKLKCDEFAEVVNNVVTVTLNQNQFDALISFCYNVGARAFQESTLLKKLNAGDFKGAAEQFLRWNKATKNGVKIVLEGLTNRRKDEKALFEKIGSEGTPLETAEETPQHRVTWLEGYRESDGDNTIIVAYNGSEVVEILTLESYKKEDLIAVLCQYPNAQNFIFASPDKAIPTGEQICIKKRQPTTVTKDKSVTSIADASQAIPGKNYLKLTKTNQKDEFGCFILKMEYYKDGQLKDSLNTCSGAPGRQAFKKALESVQKSFQPLPEGKWRIENIKWATGKDRYIGEFPTPGVGPVSTPLTYVEPNSTRRSAIEIHIDWNRRKGYPGTAGCVGVYTIADYQRFVGWLRETDPRDFYVDWGLGTCPNP